MNNNALHNQQGFTLIEMIVSIAIFTIVAVVAVGALLKIIDANKTSQALQTTINNMDFALESISRDLRTGSNLYCVPNSNTPYNLAANASLPNPQSCSLTSSSWMLAFYSSKAVSNGSGGLCYLVHEYIYDTTNTSGPVLSKAEQSSCSSGITSTNFAPITSGIHFTTGAIAVKTSDVAGIQPYTFMHFVGYSGTREVDKSYFDIQTSVSQRVGG